MTIKKADYTIRCELGACGNIADYSIVLDRVSCANNIHICSECAKKLGALINKTIKESDNHDKSKKN